MGTELRLTLRETTRHIWRRGTPTPNDRRLDNICAKPDKETHEGYAHRACHNPEMELRAQ